MTDPADVMASQPFRMTMLGACTSVSLMSDNEEPELTVFFAVAVCCGPAAAL